MGTRLSDSPLYAHLWATEELEAVFSEEARLGRWLEILVALARAQAALGLIPRDSADAIAEHATVDALDLAYVAAQTRVTSHSTLGLIRGLTRVLPEHAREHVYYGATVQDVTDTWFATVVRDVGALVWRDLRRLERLACDLAVRYRDTPMPGRTHGQPGAPITFGLKAAGWADELRRHLDRLSAGRPRWLVGQLGGGVGALGFFGTQGPALRARFCAELGLGDPGISWLTARDRVAEFGHLLAMTCGTVARIGGEVYELQRPEIGELAEPTTPEAVGSITMPHKRNPETAEHLDTLARLARASAGVLLESVVSQHERDGRAWKAEWIAFPEVCLLAGTALQLAVHLLEGLEVDPEAMAADLARNPAAVVAEPLLAALAPRLGKHRAAQLLHDTWQAPGATDDPVGTLAATGVAPAAQLRAWTSEAAPPAAGAMVDAVVARARAAWGQEPEGWP